MATPAANLVNLERVHKSYGIRPLLDGVSLGIRGGESFSPIEHGGLTAEAVLTLASEPTQGPVKSGKTLSGDLQEIGELAVRGQAFRTVAARVVAQEPPKGPEVVPGGFRLVELAPGVTYEQVRALTGAPLQPIG